MIGDTIQLMINKNDFSHLEEICQSIAESAVQFRRILRNSLDSAPLEIIQNLNLSEKEKKNLLWDTFVTSRVVKNCTDLQSVFDKIKTEDLEWLRPGALSHLVSNEDSAKIIVQKVSETKDIVQNMGLNPLLLGTFSSNAFILLVIKGQESSALQLYKDFENDLETQILKYYSTSKMVDSSEIFNNFLKKHGINLEEKK